ncbi:protein phosphatase 1 regulatory subunit 36 [Gadus morhua]|uniref:protein phosphatase 1 regulatory subunit 36 n=1 Tax=Gadus morhua TaxID=8049 RepID=UPI0011B4CE98|nr:protein phosphatase 1 regulatory subunit 36 [Gadus morhua]
MSGMPTFGTVTDRGRQSPRKAMSHLSAYVNSTKPRQRGPVTMENLKKVAVGLLLQSQSPPIPRCLLDVLKREELDDFLMALLLYLACFREQHALQSRPRPLMGSVRESVSREEEEVRVKVELSRNKMAVCYSALLLGLASPQHTHTACGRSLVSANDRDRDLYECLYRLFSLVPWVAFYRRDLELIRAELSRLLRPSACRPPTEDPGEGTPGRRRRCPPVKSSLSQCSVLIRDFLPLPQEKSPDLFLRTSRGTGGLLGARGPPGPRPRCDTQALLEELEERLASGSFGVLGRPRKEFNLSTLLPRARFRGDRQGEEEGASLPTSAVPGRGHTGASRATTEAPSSDSD